jgi:hypothetical protein
MFTPGAVTSGWKKEKSILIEKTTKN